MIGKLLANAAYWLIQVETWNYLRPGDLNQIEMYKKFAWNFMRLK